jgi:hypothetical protein
MKREIQLAIVLRGRLDRERLQALRDSLGLQRQGRLSDTEDEAFGYRYLRDDQSAEMSLWRLDDDRWRVVVFSDAGTRSEPSEVADIAAAVRAAAPKAGLTVESERVYESSAKPDFATVNRNENWLRTMHWDLPAQTLEELWYVLGLSPSADEQRKRAALQQFMTVPAWEAAPEPLRREAAEFLA